MSVTEAVRDVMPDIDDLVPAESLTDVEDSAKAEKFPKVLRRRLDRFFVDEELSPKADRMMWTKIAVGLCVLGSSWFVIYMFRPHSWKFLALYLAGGLAQTFLLLNIAHDSNHNAIS